MRITLDEPFVVTIDGHKHYINRPLYDAFGYLLEEQAEQRVKNCQECGRLYNVDT